MPGDKSISHRLALLCGLASGNSRLDGFLTSQDCLGTVSAVQALGASALNTGTTVAIRGTGTVFSAPAAVLDMGNSGTGIRLLTGLLAGHGFASHLTGDASLCSRPMKRIKDPLELMGAKLELTGPKGCPPIKITGGNLKGIEYRLPVASAQVKSCVLLAGLFADGTTTVIEPEPTRDHTELLFRAMGIPVDVDGLHISIKGYGSVGPRLQAGVWQVPGDFSSAAFWLIAAACREGAEVAIQGVGLNPRRTALLNVLARMGAEIAIEEDDPTDSRAWEATGTVIVRGRRLHGTEIGGQEIPNLIDEIPILAVAGALSDGKTVIRDAAELRVKESDRIRTTATMLVSMGVKVEEQPDGMIVHGAKKICGGAEIDSFDDHRIAMSAAILGLSADTPIRISKTWCVGTSYPSFWQDLNKVTGANAE